LAKKAALNSYHVSFICSPTTTPSKFRIVLSSTKQMSKSNTYIKFNRHQNSQLPTSLSLCFVHLQWSELPNRALLTSVEVGSSAQNIAELRRQTCAHVHAVAHICHPLQSDSREVRTPAWASTPAPPLAHPNHTFTIPTPLFSMQCVQRAPTF
jgi:hypothetical protein